MQSAESKKLEVSGLAERFQKTRNLTVKFCKPLEIEDFIPQPSEDVSPVKWNIAHTTWFFEEMILKRFDPKYREFDPSFCFLFNSYYNTVGKRTQRHQRGDLSRPTVDRVFKYRKHVDQAVIALLDQNQDSELLLLVELGINHEQQHQELLATDLKFTFSLNPTNPVYQSDFALVENVEEQQQTTKAFEEGTYNIGFGAEGFCFDNELPRHKVHIQAFGINNGLVTNSDFIEFIKDGGYRDHRLWHSDGWDWVNENEISMPLYWTETGEGKYENYTLAGRRTVKEELPVCHVSFYEAAAFAEWSGMRLPTEFEWEAANTHFDWGSRWEWTSSAYLPYPGFKTAEGAVGEYNGKFMINQMVLRGASCATPEGHSRPTYRNFFQPHLRWQFTGIRLAS